jgi:hypothetical protein
LTIESCHHAVQEVEMPGEGRQLKFHGVALNVVDIDEEYEAYTATVSMDYGDLKIRESACGESEVDAVANAIFRTFAGPAPVLMRVAVSTEWLETTVTIDIDLCGVSRRVSASGCKSVACLVVKAIVKFINELADNAEPGSDLARACKVRSSLIGGDDGRTDGRTDTA